MSVFWWIFFITSKCHVNPQIVEDAFCYNEPSVEGFKSFINNCTFSANLFPHHLGFPKIRGFNSCHQNRACSQGAFFFGSNNFSSHHGLWRSHRPCGPRDDGGPVLSQDACERPTGLCRPSCTERRVCSRQNARRESQVVTE